MTYSNASAWADEHVPKDDFNSFDEWLQSATVDSDKGLKTGSLLEEPEFVDLMHSYWLNEVGSDIRGEQEEFIEDSVLIERDVFNELTQKSGTKIVYSSQAIQIGNKIIEKVDFIQPVRIPETGQAPRILAPIVSPTVKQERRNILSQFGTRVLKFLRRGK